MKSITILNRIKKEESCSLHDIDLLTKALKRENKLREKESIRFRLLYGDFDIVNNDFENVGVTKQYMPPMSFNDLYDIFK